jgi:glycosyltransferase involved in cell wall biosynthesis
MACRQAAFSSLREELSLGDDQPLIGMIGKLVWYKDPVVFARAAVLVHKKHPEVAYCVIGSGSALPAVQEFLAQQKLTSCFFLIPRRPDAPWLARDFDIGVLCSRMESLPNVGLE